MPVVVVPYDPAWAATYQHLKSAIWPKVQAFAVAIEHVGSTSVPGLAAKPIIDIDVVVLDSANSDLAVAALTEMGYQHVGNLGLEGREAMKEPDGSPRHNLYVCLQDSEPYRNHILIRDHLLANPDAVREYGDLKLQLAAKFPDDIEGYIDGKTDFLIGILRSSGFGDEATERAEAINRKKV